MRLKFLNPLRPGQRGLPALRSDRRVGDALMDLDTTALAQGLDLAIDELLTVRVALSREPVALPEVAFDDALRTSPEYQQARKDFATGIERLLDAPWDALPQAVLDIESLANVMAGRAAEVGWQLGLRGGDGRG